MRTHGEAAHRCRERPVAGADEAGVVGHDVLVAGEKSYVVQIEQDVDDGRLTRGQTVDLNPAIGRESDGRTRPRYIDDTSENVEMAVQLGMRGVVFRDSAGLRTELTRTGLLVDKIQGRLL